MQYKMAEQKGSNVIFIDKEKHEFDNIKTYRDLNAFIDSRRNNTKYILVKVKYQNTVMLK